MRIFKPTKLSIDQTSVNLRGNNKGFTLIEMLIVMPIAIMISGSLLSVLFDQYGEMLIDTAEANLRLEAQNMLLNLEDELLFTLEYGTELYSYLSDPYAPSGGWDYDTTPDTLIIYETALNSSRRDPDREFVRRKGNGSCDGYKPLAVNNLVYFSVPNEGDSYRTMYKRTLIPQYTYCSVDDNTGNYCTVNGSSSCKGNFKEHSCPAANVTTGNCTRVDGQLTERLVDFVVTYYDENNLVTPNPSQGEKIELLITLGDKKYGKEFEITSRFIIKKIN